MQPPLLTVVVELVLWLAIVQLHPMVASGMAILKIYGKLLPQISVNPVN